VLSIAWGAAQVLLDAAGLLDLQPQLASELTTLHTGIVAELEHRAAEGVLAPALSRQSGSIG
jgi:hypothetical protein